MHQQPARRAAALGVIGRAITVDTPGLEQAVILFKFTAVVGSVDAVGAATATRASCARAYGRAFNSSTATVTPTLSRKTTVTELTPFAYGPALGEVPPAPIVTVKESPRFSALCVPSI